MSVARLSRSAVCLSHHVDGLELTCAVEQIPGLLLSDGRDQLDQSLGAIQDLARAQTPQCAVESDWTWWRGEPVIVHPSARRKGMRYAIECSDWMIFIAAVRAVVPRITVQCRAEYLLRVGALRAFDEVRTWVEHHLLTQVQGRPDDDKERWRIARIDLAADVMGVSIKSSRLWHFTSRANARKGYENEPEDQG